MHAEEEIYFSDLEDKFCAAITLIAGEAPVKLPGKLANKLIKTINC